MKVSEFFRIEELVPPGVFKTFGIVSVQFLRPELLVVLDLLRRKVGRPVIVNDYHQGGPYKESGYRVPWTKTGARMSMHKSGCAADVKVHGMIPREILAVILANFDEFRAAGMTTYENPDHTPTWLHIDCRIVVQPHPTKFRVVDP